MYKETTTDSDFKKRKSKGLLGLLIFLSVGLAQADDQQFIEKLSVLGTKEVLPTRPGSAHVLSEQELKKFDFIDIHQVLRSIPGVNIQEEDGFGLRPNIGLRGGHPHRSKKVVLMEDGVLIGPAPYSAPAAYYFPQMSKISEIEVFKGVPATAFGPNNIGGAINLVSKTNPKGLTLAAQQGSFSSSEHRLSAGAEFYGDISLDLSNYETQGFKELTNKDDTGFVRNNLTFKWEKFIAHREQTLRFKFNGSNEASNETYAGLTDADFAANPYQRYTATENDRMTWSHRQYFLDYGINTTDDSRLRATVYHHRFLRSWNKLNGFAGTNSLNPSQDITEVLNNPDLAVNNYYYQVLSGQADSGALSDDRDVLDLGNNQRQYYSQGLQLLWNTDWFAEQSNHHLQLGYRLHQDGIERFHESRYYNMASGRLQENSLRNQTTTVLNGGQSQVHTLTASHEAKWNKLTTQSILRYEDISYDFTNHLTAESSSSSEALLAPGFGLFHQTFDSLGFLFGVNKGFTPVGPGQASNVNAEESLNYELGLRHTGSVGFELIAFYSDYTNLLGTCTQSGGCSVNQLDQSFNGGKAETLGAEMLLHWDFKTKSMNFPVRLTTTYTEARFKNSFTSALNEWGDGDVISGDPIPYIPNWQSHLVLGWEWGAWRSYVSANYLGEMADQAVATDRKTIPSRMVYGFSTSYQWGEMKLKLRLDNLTDEAYAVSRRPFGLRPGRPFMAFIGFESAFY